MIEFLDWVTRAGGVIAVLLLILGFIFREKWKQILKRSLAEDLERLKNELAKEHAEHSASLIPQIEQIKHDFHQKLEAYKVSLIAETEAIKAKGDLRKSIALRYAEIEFERLVKLEQIVAAIGSEILSMAVVDTSIKSAEHLTIALNKIQEFNLLTLEAEMFISLEDTKQMIEFRSQLIDIAKDYVGLGKPALPNNHQNYVNEIKISSIIHSKLMKQIETLGKL